jgi:hypothetical protein
VEGKMTRHGETNNLVEILREWQTLEDQTINLSNELMKKSDNAFVKVTTEMIRRDSEKHKAMLQFLLDHLTKASASLTPQDLMPLSDIMDKHIQAEAKSMALANSALTKNKDVFAGYILSYLMGDEIKHHEMLTRLDHMKGAVYEYGQSRDERVIAS